MPDTDATWYLRSKGKVFGPFSREQLAAMKRSTRLTPASEVSTDRQRWVKAELVPGLFVAAKRAVEAAVREDLAGEIPLEATREPGTSPPGPHDAHAWYYGEGNERRGPVSYRELRDLAADGRVTSETSVWNETLGDWTAAASATDLRFHNAPSVVTQSYPPKGKAFGGSSRSAASIDAPEDLGFDLSRPPNATEWCA